jgi:hypothetical protein
MEQSSKIRLFPLSGPCMPVLVVSAVLRTSYHQADDVQTTDGAKFIALQETLEAWPRRSLSNYKSIPTYPIHAERIAGALSKFEMTDLLHDRYNHLTHATRKDLRLLVR